jgi:hypothetical protein
MALQLPQSQLWSAYACLCYFLFLFQFGFVRIGINYSCYYVCYSFTRACVEQCEKTGCVGEKCFQHCKFSSDGKPVGGPWYLQEPLYLQWKQWDCRSDCQYHCMLVREEEREKLGGKPVKYHGKWPFHRAYGFQVSMCNFLVQL